MYNSKYPLGNKTLLCCWGIVNIWKTEIIFMGQQIFTFVTKNI